MASSTGAGRAGTARDGPAPIWWGEQLDALVELTADWCWTADAALRFTRFDVVGPAPEALPCLDGWLGRRLWEVLAEPESADDRARLDARLEAREHFRDLRLAGADATGVLRYLSLSGSPTTDRRGRLCGYRGVARDVTHQQRHELDLLRFRAAIDACPDLIYLVDPHEMRFVYVNDTALQKSGYTRDEYLALPPSFVNRVPDEQLHALYEQVIATGDAGMTSEVHAESKEGLRGWFETLRRSVTVGGRNLIVTVARDTTARKLAEQSARRLGLMYAALGATNEAILHAHDEHDLFQRVCDAAVSAGSFTQASVMLPDTITGWMRIVAYNGDATQRIGDQAISVDETIPEGEGLVGTAYRTRKTCVSNAIAGDDVTRHWRQRAADAGVLSAAAIPLVQEERAKGVLLLCSDEDEAFDSAIVDLLERMAANIAFALTNFEREAERRKAEERVQYLATHDSLTGLPNRFMFTELLSHAVEAARRYQRPFAVLFIDLDRFKVINDTLGHDAGDALLIDIAARFRSVLRASDIAARLGGDEFVVMLGEIDEPWRLSTVARKLLSEVTRPVTALGHECRVTASIGISTCPDDAEDAQSLMKYADMAMYLAKEKGKNNFQFYSPTSRTDALERMSLEVQLRHALEREELSLAWQPKLDFTTGAITGVEALLRWNNADLGSITPAQFIPVAEESGLIVPIGQWVLERACEQNVAWQRRGLPPVCVAVNLSARQFGDPDLLDHIVKTLDASGMAPALLELEVTESMVLHNAAHAAELLGALKQLGVRIAIDDFGTGHSSLAQLKRFPIDTLKVDRSFIRDIPDDAEDKAITEAIIAMGKALSMTVVAEGVETEAQMHFLRALACDGMQGFYFSKPLPADDFAELLANHVATQPE